jgi:type VI secretion system (T6SS) effector Hcp
MSERKEEGTGELEDEQLSDVSGGVGGVPGTGLMEEEGVVSPRDPASGLPTGKRMHKPFVITKEIDKSSP